MVQILHSGRSYQENIWEEKDISNHMIHYLVLKLDLGCCVSQCSVAMTNT